MRQTDTDAPKDGDGVSRGGAEYRAGWAEALEILGQRLQAEAARGVRSEAKGLEKSMSIVHEMHKAMTEKADG